MEINNQLILNKFTKLRRANTKYGKAPHKPILLISILELIKEGHYLQNKFPITPELVAKFAENWNVLVATGHTPDFTQPFGRLQNEILKGERIWKVETLGDVDAIRYEKNFSTFQGHVLYGAFHPFIYDFLMTSDHLNQVIELLLETHLPNQKHAYYQKTPNNYWQNVEVSILEDKPEPYHVPETKQQEQTVYVRSNVFKKTIPKIYEYTCSVTGMQVIDSKGNGLIDACHIKPLSQGGYDHVSNGIALSPNIHRAFDKGLISFDKKLQVIVSNAFREIEENDYSLRRLKDRKLRLPSSVKYRPDLDNVEWHRENVFLV